MSWRFAFYITCGSCKFCQWICNSGGKILLNFKPDPHTAELLLPGWVLQRSIKPNKVTYLLWNSSLLSSRRIWCTGWACQIHAAMHMASGGFNSLAENNFLVSQLSSCLVDGSPWVWLCIYREKVGRRAKAQGAHRVFALLAATRCSAVCHSSVRVLSCSVTWLYYFPCEEVLIRGPFLTTTDVFYIWRNIYYFISG